MGKLIDGQWVTDDLITSNNKGSFTRPDSSFRETISKDHKVYQPEVGRYHLYVSYACPWAHRTLMMRSLKGLEEMISISVVHPDMLENGWSFDSGFKGATGDPLNDKKFLKDIYTKADPHYTGRVTVPVLWDKKTETIVNNESSEVIRILNSAFNELLPGGHAEAQDFFPEEHRQEIEAWNEKIYHNVNNGVYRSGFAKSQSAYDEAVSGLFATLDELDRHLANNQFLAGDQLTEADLRLFPTLIRFDQVYFFHFKCNLRRVKDYPHLYDYTKRLYQVPEIQKTVNFEHIKRHYYYSQNGVNPYRIIPLGPEENF